MKAYDSVKWTFILEVLRVMGFLNIMIKWIEACIFSPKFSVCLNGELVGFFGSYNELKQRDMLSLDLFVMVMEALSGLLNKTTMNPNFKHHKGCNVLNITHLCFANDLMLFCRVEVMQTQRA